MSPQIDQVLAQAVNDPDVMETNEWLDALESVIENEGPERAHYLMERMVDLARRRGAHIPFSSNTAYVNTIPADQGEHCERGHQLQGSTTCVGPPDISVRTSPPHRGCELTFYDNQFGGLAR